MVQEYSDDKAVRQGTQRCQARALSPCSTSVNSNFMQASRITPTQVSQGHTRHSTLLMEYMEEEEDEHEDDNNAAKAAEDDESSTHSIPDYEEDTYSTHSTPQCRTSTSSMREPEYVPRRLLHPSNRPAQAPSPMKASQICRYITAREKNMTINHDTQTGDSAQVEAVKSSTDRSRCDRVLSSVPTVPRESRRCSSSPKEEQIQNSDEYDEALNLLQSNAGQSFGYRYRQSSVHEWPRR
jgi:hypothetical protein